MSFCTKCGNQINEGVRFCSKCGGAVEMPEAKQPLQHLSPDEHTKMGSLQFNVPDEDNSTVTIAGKVLKISFLMKVISLAACVLFFLPLATLSERGESLSINLAGSLAQSPVDILFLLVPAALFAAFQFKQIKQKFAFLSGKLFYISLIISILAVIAFVLMAIGNTSMVNNMNMSHYYSNIKISFTFWYWLTLILYASMGFLSIMCIKTLKKNKTN